MKTREELAKEFSKYEPSKPGNGALDHYRAGLYEGFLAGHKAAQQWTSVKDRLPKIYDNRESSEEVLWLTSCKEIRVSFLQRLHFGFRVDWGEFGLLKLDDVTHWMPLPELPEDKK